MFGIGVGLTDLPVRRGGGSVYAEYALALDYKQGRYRSGNQFTSDVSALTGYSYTRSGVGSASDASGSVTQFAANTPRIIPGRGVLIEEARTQLLVNPAAPATQSVTVAAVAHTLSFYGTGTVTLSGVSTAGPLVGTGANSRVSLTFTPTAGSLTLTVTGSVTFANLEAGAFATSYMPNTGARAADLLSFGGLSVSGDYTVHGAIEFSAITTQYQTVLQLTNGATDYIYVARQPGGIVYALYRIAPGAELTLSSGAAKAGARTVKFAVTRAGNVYTLFLDGVSIGGVTAAGMLASTTLRVGNYQGVQDFLNGYVQLEAILPRAMTSAEAIAATS